MTRMKVIQNNARRVVFAAAARDERVVVRAGASLVYLFFLDQKRDTERSLSIELAGRGAHATVLGFNIGARGAVHSTVTTAYDAPATGGRVYMSSVLGGTARSFVRGMIRIGKEAVGADAYFAHHALLVSPRAEAKTSPSLEIEANEVTASHAATVSSFDAAVLFYLLSRGIRAETAKKLVIESFVSAHLGEIPEAHRVRCLRLVRRRLAALTV